MRKINKFEKEQGYTQKDLTIKKCFRCGNNLLKEKGSLSKEYPFYCSCCDENMFNFESK